MADVEFSCEGRVAHVRLNRPDHMNAITPGMDDLLADAWGRIDALDAESFGLVNEIVAPADLDVVALRWTDKINAASPLANQAAKAAVRARLEHPLEIALSTRFEHIERYATSVDRRESEAAAKEKRKPVWTGK